ncbi:MAG: TrkA family potassium uptake protein [Lachnospiraceae bacterium]|nr:TrkA family potassium uptake protein [Lachnospiraceae bacterium]MCI9479606.1 TrkA family potassium uptake protein [Lachnospiraceae bacterium]MCI9622675.1 TrkA family potassium uptake protein [Lachnospiraceae bacterium]
MKSILMIGMGKFGHLLCMNMAELDNEIMIVDEEEERLADLLPIVTSAQIGDCTNVEVLKSLGIRNFDVCFVCISGNFQNSLEITSLLKEMGAAYVVSKAERDIQAKFLLRNGADEVIYPERDTAERAAKKFSSDHVFDYLELTDDYGIYEIPLLKEWLGHSIRELNFRARYQVNILGIKTGEELSLLPSADHIFEKDQHLMVIGKKKDVDKILHRM